jgi:hypothetical protein
LNITWVELEVGMVMGAGNKRKQVRIRQRFKTELLKDGIIHSFEGITASVSQGGAFIKTKDWNSFRTNDKTVITVYLPPFFTGQDATIGLQGSAVITRVDEDNEGVAVEFLKNFRQFERIDEMDIPGKIRYKKLAHYLSSYTEVPLKKFAKSHPAGFLVEKTQKSLDKDVIFQFSTKSLEDPEIIEALKKGTTAGDALEARVVEIKGKKTDPTHARITIGRSAQNDIILYNKMVSKSHAYLELGGTVEGCSLVDVGSTNGTLLNDRELTPHQSYPLADGDEISFGPETKVVYLSAKTFHEFLTQMTFPSP